MLFYHFQAPHTVHFLICKKWNGDLLNNWRAGNHWIFFQTCCVHAIKRIERVLNYSHAAAHSPKCLQSLKQCLLFNLLVQILLYRAFKTVVSLGRWYNRKHIKYWLTHLPTLDIKQWDNRIPSALMIKDVLWMCSATLNNKLNSCPLNGRILQYLQWIGLLVHKSNFFVNELNAPGPLL